MEKITRYLCDDCNVGMIFGYNIGFGDVLICPECGFEEIQAVGVSNGTIRWVSYSVASPPAPAQNEKMSGAKMMFDSRKYTIEAVALIEEWVKKQEKPFEMRADAWISLGEAIEQALERAFKAGYSQGKSQAFSNSPYERPK